MKLPFMFAPKYRDFVKDFMDSGHPEYSLFGGRNSAKSTTIYMLEIAIVMTEGCVVVVRRHYNTIETSSFNGIKKIIYTNNL